MQQSNTLKACFGNSSILMTLKQKLAESQAKGERTERALQEYVNLTATSRIKASQAQQRLAELKTEALLHAQTGEAFQRVVQGVQEAQSEMALMADEFKQASLIELPESIIPSVASKPPRPQSQ